MKKQISLLLLIGFSLSVFCQRNYYWIKFKDKNNNSYSLNNPQQFLSQRSVDRRTIQHLNLDSTDLPISQMYVDGITPFISELKYRLKWINCVVVKIDSAAQFDSLKQLTFVDSIGGIEFSPARSLLKQNKFEDVFPVDAHVIYPSKYGAAYHQINMLNADPLHRMGYRGKDIIISMMDNGFENVDANPAYDSVRSRILYTWDYVNNEVNVSNEGGHGALSFSCIGSNLPDQFIGTAPDASFILNHTEDNGHEWVMEEYSWQAAAEAADSAGANIFSTSLGYTQFDNNYGNHSYQDLTGDKTVMTHAGNMAFKKGIIVLNSGGNEGTSAWHFISAPADGDDILAVGAVDMNGRLANFSGRGPNAKGKIKPDLCAQGVSSAVVNTNASIGSSNGTSFSCPILAGCVASLWSAFPDRSAIEVRNAVMVSSDLFRQPNDSLGYGIPDFYKAFIFLKTNYSGDILHFSNEVLAFPNPFGNELSVCLFHNDSLGQTHTIELFNLLGQKVYSTDTYLPPNNFGILRLEGVNALEVGEYVMRIDGDKSQTLKIVKVK